MERSERHNPQPAIRRLKRNYLFGLVGLAALAVTAFGLALAALSDQVVFERQVIQAADALELEGGLERPSQRAALDALRASADRQRHQRDRYRLLQSAVFALILVLLAVGVWRIVPARIRQLGAVVRRLEETQNHWQTIYASISDGLITLAPDGRIVAMNPSAEALVGYRSGEVAGRSLQLLLPEPERSRCAELKAELLRDEPVAGRELLLLHRDGRIISTELDSNPMQWEGERQFLLVVRDVGARKELEERQNEALFYDLLEDLSKKDEAARELTRRATTDPLTGAYNRAKFDERLAEEIARAQRTGSPLALVILDIDNFKGINDTFGHPTGDQVLNELAAIARNNLRSADLFARWGGEEFVILAPDTSSAGGHRLAEKIRAAIERHPFDEVGQVTASLGVAEYLPEESVGTLMRRADEALYAAKQGGRNRVVLAPGRTSGTAP